MGSVVLVVGVKPSKELVGKLNTREHRVFMIAGCVTARDVMQAIPEGAELGCQL